MNYFLRAVFFTGLAIKRTALVVLLLMLVGESWGQTTIAQQDFESTPATPVWAISAGSGNISTTTGSGDVPTLQRIRNGSRSWQVNNASATLDLSSVTVTGFTGVQVTLYISSTSVNATNGADVGDNVRVFANVNGAGFPGSADITVTGNNNARWGYNTTGVTTSSGTPVSVGGTSGTNQGTIYSRLIINIPDGSNSVALRVIALNNDANEIWNVDDVQITGTCSSIPADPTGTITPLANPACTSTTLNYNNASGSIYWQSSATGTSTANPTTSDLTVNTSGTYYVRAFNGTCWSTGSIASTAITIVAGAPSSPFFTPSTTTNNVASPCATATGLTYTVTNVAGVTYSWTVPSGWSITSGATTNQITVNPSSNSGNVTANAANVCGNTSTNFVVTPVVSAPSAPVFTASNATNNVAAPNGGAGGYTYQVNAVAGVTYSWAVPSGWSITAGGTTNTITVNTGNTSGNVTATFTNACGTGSTNFAVTPVVATYYSQGSGSPSTLSNWNSIRGGGGFTPASTTGGNFVIQNTHTMTTIGAVTFGSAGNSLTIETGGSLVAGHQVSLGGTMSVQSNATYQHNFNAGTIPTATWDAASNCTITGMTNSIPANLNGIGQAFGNFTWNNPGQSGTGFINIESSSFSVAGIMTVGPNANNLLSFGNTGGPYTNAINTLVVSGGLLNGVGSATGTITVNVTNNVTVSGGTFVVSGGSGVVNFTVGRDLLITGGTVTILNSSSSVTNDLRVNRDVIISGSGKINLKSNSSSAGFGTITISRDFISTGTSVATLGANGIVDFGSGTVTSNAIYIARNFDKSGVGTFGTSASGAALGFVFNGGGTTQTLSYAGANSLYTSYVVNANSVVQLLTNLTLGTATNPASTFTVSNTGTLNFQTFSIIAGNTTDPRFNTSSGSTLITSNTSGIGGTSGSGSLQSFGSIGTTAAAGRANLPAGVNYTYNGNTSSPFPVTGTFGNPGLITVNATVTSNLTATLTVTTGVTVNNGGRFNLNPTTNDLNLNNAALLINSGGIFDNGGENQVTNGGGTPSITINGTFITRDVQGFTGLNTSIPGISPALNAGCTIEYGLTGAQAVTTRSDYRNITFSGSGNKTLSGAFNPNGVAYITGSAVVQQGSNTFGDGTTRLTMDGGRLVMTGARTLPDMDGTYTLTGGVVEFAGTANQRIKGTATYPYQNIEVTGVGVANSNGNINLNSGGTFTVKSTGIFTMNDNSIVGPTGSQTLTIETGGKFVCNVPLGFYGAAGFPNSPCVRNDIETVTLQTNSTIEYSRTTAQDFTPISTTPLVTNYQNVIISGGGTKTLTGAVTMEGILTLTSGLVTTTTHLLTLSSSATCPSGGSTTSLINGPLRKLGSADFTFPVGKLVITTNHYRAIGISGLSAPSDDFTAEFFRANPYTSVGSTITASGLQRVSRCEYWTLDRSAGGTANVSLSWSAESPCNLGYVNEFATLVVAHYGTSWDTYGGAGNVVGGSTFTAGSITWNNVNTFSPFALGSTSVNKNPLPFLLNNFNAKPKQSAIQLDWSVGNNHQQEKYILERSGNPQVFETIANINAKSGLTAADYVYDDTKPLNGWNYYRLRAVDHENKSNSSSIIKVWWGKGVAINILPNPATEKIVINLSAPSSIKEIQIVNAMGQVMRKLTTLQFSNEVNISSLQAGMYYIRFLGENGVTTRSFVKQ